MYEIFDFIFYTPISILIIIGIIAFAVYRKFRRGKKVSEGAAFLSREDLVSQSLFLLFVLFLWVILLSITEKMTGSLSAATSYPYWIWTIFIASVVGIIISYYFKMVLVLLVSLIGLTGWWVYQLSWWLVTFKIRSLAVPAGALKVNNLVIPAGIFFVAMIFYLLGRIHETKLGFKRSGKVYLILGILYITSILFFLSTKGGVLALRETEKGKSLFIYWQVWVPLLILVLSTFFIWIYSAIRKIISTSEAVTTGILMGVFMILPLIPIQNMFLEVRTYTRHIPLSSTGIIFIIFLNVLLFLEIIWIVYLGYFRKENWLINLGIIFLFFAIIFKYFTWSLYFLEKSVFFITTGILLLVIGWLMEKGRRYLISNLEKEENDQSNNF